MIYLNNCIYRYAGDCDINFFVGNIKGGIKDFQVSMLQDCYIPYFLQYSIQIVEF